MEPSEPSRDARADSLPASSLVLEANESLTETLKRGRGKCQMGRGHLDSELREKWTASIFAPI